ncbi:phage tail tube protein [Allokutzneria albata]|uniref:Major tail protein n=1 Tax=Allokutzneria albata TaxID=211114 RepID=A0A1H0DUM6_ALLAB|nr:phage tail tube protein [Allokutzneria albata]SDN73860.1 hypothetical protein SAMN04489726_8004 [Allokutzneria albata]
MAIPSGLSAQLMTAEESTYGTPVTPNRGFEFRQESLKLDLTRMESSALRSGTRIQRSDRWATGQRSVSGDITMEVGTVGFGRWFKHMLGAVATSQPDAVNDPDVYLHEFTIGDLPVSQTIQVGRPDVGGTVRPFTYHGCRTTQWTLECAVGEFLTMQNSILGEDEDTATALASITYPDDLVPFTFVQGALEIASSAADVKNVTINGSNALAEDRFFLGRALRKSPLEAGMREVTGNLTPEFESLAAYNRFVNGTEATLDLLFEGPTISSTYKYSLQLTANVRFDGETPNIGGPGIVEQPLPWKVVDDGTTGLTIAYQTTDATP